MLFNTAVQILIPQPSIWHKLGLKFCQITVFVSDRDQKAPDRHLSVRKHAWTRVHVHVIMSNWSLWNWHRVSSSKRRWCTQSDSCILLFFFFSSHTQTQNLPLIQLPRCLRVLSHQAGVWCLQKGMTHAGRPPQRRVSLGEGGQGTTQGECPWFEGELPDEWRIKKWVWRSGPTARLQVQRRGISRCHEM